MAWRLCIFFIWFFLLGRADGRRNYFCFLKNHLGKIAYCLRSLLFSCINRWGWCNDFNYRDPCECMSVLIQVLSCPHQFSGVHDV